MDGTEGRGHRERVRPWGGNIRGWVGPKGGAIEGRAGPQGVGGAVGWEHKGVGGAEGRGQRGWGVLRRRISAGRRNWRLDLEESLDSSYRR